MAYNEFKVLADIFDSIPPIDMGGREYKLKFQYGSHEDLMKFLELNRRMNSNAYPLVWLTTPYEVSRDRRGNGSAPTNLIIANLSSQDMLNVDRMATSFKLVLFPILDEILYTLKKSKATKYSDYSTTYFFNYSPSSKEASDIWDAIKLSLDIEFNPNCLI